MKRSYNFSAGPATITTSVLEKVQEELLNYQDTGMSLIEMSHRGSIFKEVYEESISLLQKIANIPENFDILYMTGGASTQFALVPMNLAIKGKKVSYVDTGSWAKKARQQAELQGKDVHIVASSEEDNFRFIPKNWEEVIGNTSYVHITSNNTIYGTQYASLPKLNEVKLIIDMSSDFLSKPIDWTHVGMLYAGTQKNAGPSGLCIVIIDKEYYKRENSSTPTMFRYSTFAKNESMYNTPPTFQIYVFSLILRWISEKGTLVDMLDYNKKKAKYIYDILEKYPNFYKAYAKEEDRSLMNITWNLAKPELEKEFLKDAEKRNMFGLKGHRSVGGLRASIYNAMNLEACQELANFMEDFCKEKCGYV